MVHIFGQQIYLKYKFFIWQNILQNNHQNVSVKWSHGARFDCVVYDLVEVHKIGINFKNHPAIQWVQFRGYMSMHPWEIDCRRLDSTLW